MAQTAKQPKSFKSRRAESKALKGGPIKSLLNKLRSSTLYRSYAVLFIVAAVIAGYAYTTKTKPAQGLKNSVKLATSRQPERLTELYFTDYQSIVKEATDNKPYTISFTIVNHEVQQTVYPYRVLLVSNGATTTIHEGKLTLEDTKSKDIPFDVTFDKPDTTYQVVIKLLSVNQEINVRITT